MYDLFLDNISESAVLFLLGALIVWAVGMLADQNSRIAMMNPALNPRTYRGATGP